MAKMRAIDAAVSVLEKEGVVCAFGVPGAAINPLYSALKQARLDQPYSGAPCRRRVAYGGGLHPRQGGQHRRLHRNIRPGRNRHDHGSLFGDRKFDPDPLHHRTGATRAPLQGRFSGRRYRIDRQARDQVGGDRARTGAGATGIQPGLSHHAFGTSWPGADRSADRRTTRGDRIRRRNLRAAAGLQAGRNAQADREGARHAQCRGSSADRGRRWRHQCRCIRPAGGVCRDRQCSRGADADGLGRHSR